MFIYHLYVDYMCFIGSEVVGTQTQARMFRGRPGGEEMSPKLGSLLVSSVKDRDIFLDYITAAEHVLIVDED